ncbi:hypothetical protein Fcan01_20456 [Folsomia candida]|uniref:Uncharacterized protein n=1 Tax=Folsomia candida TaxID=158441 RepID=A0A226DHV2_FOLCA|nr:hypothetical protein Fcan01_20456 [Folsomia candida]
MPENQIFVQNISDVHSWDLLKQGSNGVPLLDFGLTPTNELFSCCHGVEINQKSGTIRIILEPVREFGSAVPLFRREDVLQILGGNVEHPVLSLTSTVEPWSDTDILVTMMHTLHWVQGLLLKESGDEFKKQLPPNLVENLGEIVSNDDTFFIEVGQVEINRREFNDEIIYQFGEVHINIRTNTGEANAPFAKFLSEHLSDIGKQYPILLRLRELAKLCAICEILIDKRRCVQNLKNALDHHTSDIAPLEEIFPHMFSVIKNDEHHVLKELADYRYGRNPPHPIYSEDNVQKEWRMQETRHYHRDSDEGQKDRILEHIREHLRHQDVKRFDQVATHISTRFHVPYHEVRPLIQFYLDKNPSILTRLGKMCCDSLRQKRLKEIVCSFNLELDMIGIKQRSVVESAVSLPKAVGGVSLITKLHYVPTYVCLRENEQIIYLSLRTLKRESPIPQYKQSYHERTIVDKGKESKGIEATDLNANNSSSKGKAQREITSPKTPEKYSQANNSRIWKRRKSAFNPFTSSAQRTVVVILSWI